MDNNLLKIHSTSKARIFTDSESQV
jgi:hypothetical protein